MVQPSNEYQVLDSSDNGFTKVMLVLRRRHNIDETWDPAETVQYQWIGEKRFKRDPAGVLVPKTADDYKREISALTALPTLPTAHDPNDWS